MSNQIKKISISELPLSGQADMIVKLAEDFGKTVEGPNACPETVNYTLNYQEKTDSIEKRTAALKSITENVDGSIKKIAFDTRRINQETERNPRVNLQYWHRSDPFISAEDELKLNVFAKLMKCLEDLKADYGTQPEWFESYARVLYDSVGNVVKLKEADYNVYRPQLSYLEQLLYTRYRLSMEDISFKPEIELKAVILSRDEPLMKRGEFLRRTGGFPNKQNNKIIVDGNGNTSQSIIEAIFGNNGLRKGSEKSVTRQITITIKDTVDE